MIFDMHNDILTSDLPSKYCHSILKRSENKIVCALWTTNLHGNILSGVIKQSKIIKKIDNCYFALEDLHFLCDENNRYVSDSKKCLYSNKAEVRCAEIALKLSTIPILYAGLTWNYDNCLAGGALGSGRLSDSGREVIQILTAAGIIIDTAHLNSQSFYDVLDETDSVINSHTAADEVTSHLRNLDAQKIHLIIERGGIIGVTPVKDFIGGNKISDYINHIDYFVQKFGADNLSIGTDFYGTTPLDELNEYKSFEIIKEKMEKLGYPIGVIEKIFYKNAENYFANKKI